ncbi:MAG TPA: PAS domain S-box protein, partial [Candidatus Limnocylindrales bacterium]|nr:PAS domain S-box protein [Candidatus Limnocylindrales bacterium]
MNLDRQENRVETALHPALLAQLRALGLSTETPAPEGWTALLHHVSEAYHARERAAAAPAVTGDEVADEDLYLFEVSADAILIFSPADERVLAANPRASELYGYGRDELIGLSLEAVSSNPAAGRAHIDAVLQSAAHAPEGWYRFETTQRRRDGTLIMVAVQARPIHYRGAPAILSINRDVTELKRAQHALALSEERFAHIFNASPVAAAV